ncbi:hypothetical protein [Flavobacterium sp. ASW18X]|uniref:hypothetical protein n=1 Tax=Flavobacterium sp. ASW18X TaxID=2572595 RepID=UPI00146BD951|nr:hypothetical protein [Flavobacterium sp. ASW18X]
MAYNKLFNLISIFTSARRPEVKELNAVAHCENQYHHDFYCDAEKPFIANF